MPTCEQALLFGRVKRVSRERASEGWSREGLLERLASLAQIGELARRLCPRIPKSHEQMYSGIQVPLTKNPDSVKLESVILGMESKIQECLGFYMGRNYCSSFVSLFVLKHLLWCLVYVCYLFTIHNCAKTAFTSLSGANKIKTSCGSR